MLGRELKGQLLYSSEKYAAQTIKYHHVTHAYVVTSPRNDCRQTTLTTSTATRSGFFLALSLSHTRATPTHVGANCGRAQVERVAVPLGYPILVLQHKLAEKKTKKHKGKC